MRFYPVSDYKNSKVLQLHNAKVVIVKLWIIDTIQMMLEIGLNFAYARLIHRSRYGVVGFSGKQKAEVSKLLPFPE